MKKLIILSILALGIMTESYAQKFGHANFEEIVSMLPERATAEKDVQELQKKLEGRLQSMYQTYQTKLNEIQNDTTLTQSESQSLGQEIQDLERRIQEFQQTAMSEIEVKQNELMGKMFTKVREAASEVGKENEYTYIFDSSTNGSLLYAGGEDITPLIKTQLGI